MLRNVAREVHIQTVNPHRAMENRVGEKPRKIQVSSKNSIVEREFVRIENESELGQIKIKILHVEIHVRAVNRSVEIEVQRLGLVD